MQLPIGYKELNFKPLNRNMIEAVWTSITNNSGEYLVLPDGRADLILRFELDKNNKAQNITPIIAAPYSTAMRVPYKNQLGFVGLRFRPAMAGLVLNISLAKIAQNTFYGNDAIKLVPAVNKLTTGNATIDELINRLDTFADQRHNISLPKNIQKSFDLMHLSGGRISIFEIVKSLNISERSLLRNFKSLVGLSPKIFNAILRFHRAIRLLKFTNMSIANVAFEAGFSDQSHMNREFRKLGGFTPANLPDLALAGFSL